MVSDFAVFLCCVLDENAGEGSAKQMSVWEEVWTDVTPGLCPVLYTPRTNYTTIVVV